jgi:hypothetical protein
MIIKIDFVSGEERVNRREFHIDAFHMDPAPDTIAPLLIHLVDLLTGLHPDDVMHIFPGHIPELKDAQASSDVNRAMGTFRAANGDWKP